MSQSGRLYLSSVKSKIEELILKTVDSIFDSKSISFDVPSRSAANQICVPELDCFVLNNRRFQRSFKNIYTTCTTTITAQILKLTHQLCLEEIHVTKCDLFYTDVKLFQNQRKFDRVLDYISCMLGCTRLSINVVATEKEVVVGRLTFSDNGDMIDCDCTKMGGGKAIPPNIYQVGDMQSDALFIQLIEKHATYMRLAEDRFYNWFSCIILTRKGYPDVSLLLVVNN